jgi:glutamate-ammonia-ligase adenylyltransferase
VRKLINWLTVKTGEGDLFEIDTALRPNGGSGLLVTTFEAYANYQQQRGSNTAWTWEHQAMTRARFVLGSESLRKRFDAVRLAVIGATRDTKALHDEIVAMRERVRSAHPVTADRFDVKHSIGGMVDAEFCDAVPGAFKDRNAPRTGGQRGQHRLDAPCRTGRACSARYRKRGG